MVNALRMCPAFVVGYFLVGSDRLLEAMGEHVVVVAVDVEREKGKGVEAFAGQVVDGSEELFSFAVLPGKGSCAGGVEIAGVGLPGFTPSGVVVRVVGGVVKVVVGQ